MSREREEIIRVHPELRDQPDTPIAARERRAEIVRGLQLFVQDGDVYELRILECVDDAQRPFPYTAFGYFDSEHLEAMAFAALHRTVNATGVYVTMNPVIPDYLARAANHVVKSTRDMKLTSDSAIATRRRLTIDFDPVRRSSIDGSILADASKLSSTDAEKDLARQLAETVRDDLLLRGWPEPIFADSGNGYHLNYVVDLPVDDGGLVARFLKSLAARYDTPDVKVDTSLFNPSRIIKLYGTMARKGDSTTTRPHRWAKVISSLGGPDRG